MSTSYVGENDSLDTLWELREVDAWADGEERTSTRSTST